MVRKRSVAGIRFGFNVHKLSSRWRAIGCLINPLYTFYCVPEVRMVASGSPLVAITDESLNTERTGNILITKCA